MRWLVRVSWLVTILVQAQVWSLPSSAQPSSAGSPVINYRMTVHPVGLPPLSLYVEETGRGPVLLLLHGIGGSSYTWREMAHELGARHRVIAVDMRGHGRSDKPFDLAYSPFDHAAVVRAFLVERRLSQVTLVGHSYGGLVALLLAMDRSIEPHRVVRLVVIDTPAFPQPFSPGVAFLNRPVLPYLALTLLPPELPIGLALLMEKFGLDRLTGHDVTTYAEPLSEPGGAHALISTARQIVPPGFDRVIARYRTIAQPTLVLSCRHDQSVPLSSAQRLARTLPNARLKVLESCDHMPPEQAPEAVLAAMRGFLTK